MKLASPNTLTRAYYSAARQLAVESAAAQEESEMRERAVGAVTMSVACVETYLNVFAKLWLDQNPKSPHTSQIERELRKKQTLGRKIENWPHLFFEQELNFGAGPSQSFKKLLDQRNRLMHFFPESKDFVYQSITIQGLIDNSEFEALKRDTGLYAVSVAVIFVSHLLELQGVPNDQLKHAVHHWLGVPPL